MPLLRVTLVFSLLLLLAPASAVDVRHAGQALVSHEWGTFTSVAGPDGSPVEWAPLLGPADLPCFVFRLGERNRNWRSVKSLPGLVRMETPVLYFYSPHPVTLSVGVKFPDGWITEWYPQAAMVHPATSNVSVPGGMVSDSRPQRYKHGEIRWDAVEVWPGEDPEYPVGEGPSPYYAARQTDSAPLRVGRQHEKLIFYRGIGDFEVPLRPLFTAEGALQVRNTGGEPIPLAMVFENRGGKIGYRVIRGLRDAVELAAPELTGNLDDLHRELAGYLVEFGLYPKEALAMLETWRESWFEEGMRVFYIVPRAQADSLLPLTITPAPAGIARVFVGRVELLSPSIRKSIETAAAQGDVPALMKFGRFLNVFAGQISQTAPLVASTAYEAVSALLEQEFKAPQCVE